MTKELKALIEDLRLNHEYCPKEVILQAANELERLSKPEQEQEPVAIEYWLQDTMESGRWVTTGNMSRATAEDYCEVYPQGRIVEPSPPQRTEQEPVAHLWECIGRWSAYLANNGKQADCAPPSWLVDAVNNATTPPQRKLLTDEEIFACENSVTDEIVSDRDWCIHFARAIEAAVLAKYKENT